MREKLRLRGIHGTLILNVIATIGAGLSVWLITGSSAETAPLAVLIAYVAGLLTATSSRYQVFIKPDDTHDER